MLKQSKISRVVLLSMVAGSAAAAPLKPWIIVLTDISPAAVEPDDMESAIRLLAHADLFEIEGLVVSAGGSNPGGQPPQNKPVRPVLALAQFRFSLSSVALP
jgi:hypothetical protein